MSRNPPDLKLRAAPSRSCSKVGRRNADRSREAHVPGRGIDPSLGDVGDDRRHQRVAQRARDLLGERTRANVVLAERHVRAVLLGSADGHEDRGRAGGDPVAQLGPGEVLDEYAARGCGGGYRR